MDKPSDADWCPEVELYSDHVLHGIHLPGILDRHTCKCDAQAVTTDPVGSWMNAFEQQLKFCAHSCATSLDSLLQQIKQQKRLMTGQLLQHLEQQKRLMTSHRTVL